MLYSFYDYTLDEARRELRRTGQLVAVEPKVFQVLLYLLQHCDRVVSKEELLEQCWPEAFVSEAALTRCLTKLRKVVQADRTAPPVIKTLHGQGYRCVAESRSCHPRRRGYSSYPQYKRWRQHMVRKRWSVWSPKQSDSLNVATLPVPYRKPF